MCNFFLHFTDFLRKVYGILSVQLLFTFLTASVFKWSSVITYIVQTKLVVDRLYTVMNRQKLLDMLYICCTFVGSEMQIANYISVYYTLHKQGLEDICRN